MTGVQECLSVLAFPRDRAASLSDADYDEQIVNHLGRVHQLFHAHGAVVKAHAMELTASLDPFTHTVSYISILDAIIPTDSSLYPTIEQVVLTKIALFLTQFDARQVRYMGFGFTRLLTVLGSGRVVPAPLAVKLITHALQTLDPDGHMLTSSHLVLAKLAYHTNTAALALPVLGKPIVFFPTATSSSHHGPLCSAGLPPPAYISKETGLTLTIGSGQILEYDYTVGCLHLSLGDYKEAIAAFARVISYPTRDSSVSTVMVAAHRRWVLASLVVYGKAEGSPPHTSATVDRVCSSMNKPYLRIAELFQNTSPADLCAEAAQAAEELKPDDDWSLVKQVVAAHKKWQIARLRDVYLTVSIADIIKTIKAPSGTPGPAALSAGAEVVEASKTPASESETVALIQGMIDEGMITAEIVNTPQPVHLRFLSEQKWATEKEFSAALQKAGQGMAQVRQLNKLASEQLSLNRDYIRQVLKEQKNAAAVVSTADKIAGASQLGAPRAGFADYDAEPDEDLMMDGSNDYGGFSRE